MECDRKACLFMGIAYLSVASQVMGARRRLLDAVPFDITATEAKADGTTDNAIPIINTWLKACKASGPATVLVPKGDFMAGEIVLEGPCPSAKPLTFEIQGNLLANTDPSVYTGDSWIKVTKVDNVIFTGGGNINGRGAKMWKYATDGSHLPVSLMFHRVGNGELRNLNVINSMGFHTKVTDSHDITVVNMTMTAPEDSPNTDGFHVSSTTNLLLNDTVVGTGDDCVSIGEGSVGIQVTRVTCGPGHGISIGSLGKRVDETPVKNITISNCTIKGATNGLRIKSFHNTRKLTVSDITFDDIVLTDVKNPIIIDQNYNSKSIPGESKVQITNAHFSNIRGTTTTPVAILLNCSKAAPCDSVQFSDINLTPSASVKAPLSSSCENAKVKTTGTVAPAAPTC